MRLALDIGSSEDMIHSIITCIWAEALRTKEGFSAILSREITHINSKFPPANLKKNILHNVLSYNVLNF